MCTMDLSVNQEVMKVHQRYETEYGNHVFNMQEAYKETDITGNNNFFNSLKTETIIDHAQDPTPLFQVNCSDDKDFKVDNSLFSYSSFKKAMDLRIHNRTVDGGRRTIFDDAEYFARNCCYKLLPITFEQVDETIIHIEHNYSLCSFNSESESEEDCSRTMDYSQIREKNYKRRKTKYPEGNDEEDVVICDNCQEDSRSDVEFAQQPQDQNLSTSLEQENPFAGQPLDLSAAPLVQEEKTEPLGNAPEETCQPDSDKENVSAELSGIRVTITRPDEKKNYQPCDLFLNDIARLVPWLIDKDCFEVDILDRTCDCHDELRRHRLYYVIAESTWQSFQSTNERVILTNDRSLGHPLRKAEKSEKPSYLVFDQVSLAKCLAEYCQEIGGCFEYTCVEEETGGGCLQEKSGLTMENEEQKALELEDEKKRPTEGMEKDANERRNRENILEEAERKGGNEMEEKGGMTAEEEKTDGMTEEEKTEGMTEEEKTDGMTEEEKTEGVTAEEEKTDGMTEEEKTEGITTEKEKTDGMAEEEKTDGIIAREEEKEKEVSETVRNVEEAEGRESRKECKVDVIKASRWSKLLKEAQVFLKPLNLASRSKVKDADEAKRHSASSKSKKASKAKGRKARTRRGKQKKKPPFQPKPKDSQIITRSMSTSEFETSQKSDKQVSRKEGRKRRDPTPPKQEPPKKRIRIPTPGEVGRNRRSATLPSQSEKVSAERMATREGPEKKEKKSGKDSRKRKEKGKRMEERRNMEKTERSLRSVANQKRIPVTSRKVRKR